MLKLCGLCFYLKAYLLFIIWFGVCDEIFGRKVVWSLIYKVQIHIQLDIISTNIREQVLETRQITGPLRCLKDPHIALPFHLF